MSSIRTVAVTGATGYIGGQVAFDLLERGYFVHATVRRNTPDRLVHLSDHRHAAANLHIFEADLLSDGSFDTAFSGSDAVIHVASPLTFKASNPMKDVIRPAIDGTNNVLRSAQKAGVRKVILTSSYFAMLSPEKTRNDPTYIHTEEDWNDSVSPTFLPYAYSKKAAEQAAWEFVKQDGVNIDLVVINPALVLGPALAPFMHSESVDVLKGIVSEKALGIIDASFHLVDVRDVSSAHIAAMESNCAKGRYFCSATKEPTFTKEMIVAAKKKGFNPPDRDLTAPWISQILKVVSFIMPAQTGHVVRFSLGVHHHGSIDKISKDLGIEFRDVDETLADTLDSLIKWGHIQPPKES